MGSRGPQTLREPQPFLLYKLPPSQCMWNPDGLQVHAPGVLACVLSKCLFQGGTLICEIVTFIDKNEAAHS